MLLGGFPMLFGDLKSLLLLWENLAQNQRYESFVEARDITEFRTRFTNEGLTFITTTLPNIGKALDSFHSTSEWIPPVGFKTRPLVFEGTDNALGLSAEIHIPVFLGKAVELAMRGNSIAVDCVRQLTLIFYKLEVEYEAETVDHFLDNFKRIDHDLGLALVDLDDYTSYLLEHMKALIGRVLCNADPLDIVPSHGSGATACRTPNWDKFHRPLLYFEKLDDVYPYSDYFFFNSTHLVDEYSRLRDSNSSSVPRARVCLVPKDSRGPRVISCEPAELMFIQQGIMRRLYETLETHPLTSGYVNFTDQTVNRELARVSSQGEKELATIDLSDASDRVSLRLIELVFPERWVRALKACRSEETVLPNGEVVKLNKFAPMGSSCCFPVEALVFWACAVASTKSVRKTRHLPEVFVYGDDIITSRFDYFDVVRGLESIGLKVNANKSYWKGPFRESCGGDFHYGVDVTPVRVRQFLSKSRTSVATNADLANSFVSKFGYASASGLLSIIEESGGYVYPRTELLLPATIRTRPGASNDVFFRRRYNQNLQRMEHRVLVLRSQSKERRPANWQELFRKQLDKARSSHLPDTLTRSDLGSTIFPSEDDGGPLGAYRYENQLAKADIKARPGWYTDPHSVVTKWVWTWLG
jgi:hypothetical protein